MSYRWLRRNKLFETTPISGFGFINTSQTKIEVVFWYTIITIFSLITIISLTSSVRMYLSNPIMTTVTITTADEDLRPFYVILDLPFIEFYDFDIDVDKEKLPPGFSADHLKFNVFAEKLVNNRYGIDTFTNKVLKKQRLLFQKNKTEAILNLWLMYGHNFVPVEDFSRNETCSLDEIYREYYSLRLFQKHKNLEVRDVKAFCIERNSQYDIIRRFVDVIGYLPSRQALFLNILLRLYTLQDSFTEDLIFLKQQTSHHLFSDLTDIYSVDSPLLDAADFYINQIGGPDAGKQLIDAARSLNITKAYILQTATFYLSRLLGLSYNGDYTLKFQPFHIDLIVQGIKILPSKDTTRDATLELKLFPNISQFDKVWQDYYSAKSTVNVQSASWQLFYRNVINGEQKEALRNIYREQGPKIRIKNPDDVDSLAVNWSSGFTVKPYSNAILNYAVGAKYIEHFNNTCNTNNHSLRCFTECKAKIFIQSCNRLPWGLSTNYDSRPLCHVEECMNKKIHKQFKKCHQLCMYCETVVWRSDAIVTSSINEQTGVTLTVQNLKENPVYPVFHKDYKYTVGNFLAEIGGQLDLWIGCNVIGLLHAVIFISKFIHRKCQLHRIVEVPSDVTIHVPEKVIFTCRENVETMNQTRNNIKNPKDKIMLTNQIYNCHIPIPPTEVAGSPSLVQLNRCLTERKGIEEGNYKSQIEKEVVKQLKRYREIMRDSKKPTRLVKEVGELKKKIDCLRKENVKLRIQMQQIKRK